MVPESNLPPQYLQALEEVAPSGTTLVQLEEEDARLTKYAVVRLTGRSPGGEPRYEDVVDLLRRELSRQIGIRRYLDQLRQFTHIEIRDP